MRGTVAKRLRRLAFKAADSAKVYGNEYEMTDAHDISIMGIGNNWKHMPVAWWRWGAIRVKGVRGIYKQLKRAFKAERRENANGLRPTIA